MDSEASIPITCDRDIVVARQRGRALAGQMGFSSSDQIAIATAISELARNVVEYAKTGQITVGTVHAGDNGRVGLRIVARDEGPGIPDISLAVKDGYSTSGSLGLGLPGTRRLMDEFEVVSEVGRGTTVTICKWLE